MVLRSGAPHRRTHAGNQPMNLMRWLYELFNLHLIVRTDCNHVAYSFLRSDGRIIYFVAGRTSYRRTV